MSRNRRLDTEAISGLFWSFFEKFGAKLLSFVFNIVVARLLSIDDFGRIGMIMVFVALANTFVESGLGAAIIQKKKLDNYDYDTVFIWNLLVSLILYIVLYFSAPFIASFYRMMDLVLLLRVQGVILLINAFCIVPTTTLMKQLKFKQIFKVNIVSIVLGSSVGIILALYGFGIWSLVVKMIFVSLFQCMLLWILCKWKPRLMFSFRSFKGMFNYGTFILLSSLANKFYDNIQSLIIGRSFSASTLGLYTQAKSLEQIPSDTLSTAVNQVFFPVFSKMQDDMIGLRKNIKMNLQMLSFLNFPMSAFLMVVAEPIIVLLYSDKWLGSVYYFKILCLYSMLITINTTNIVLLKSIGKVKLFFYSQIVKRIVGVIIIFFGLYYFGMKGLLWGVVINAYLWWIIGSYCSDKAIGKFGFILQFKYVSPWLFVSLLCSYFTGYVLDCLCLNYVSQIVIGFCVYSFVYIGISFLFKFYPILFCFDYLKNNIIKFNR